MIALSSNVSLEFLAALRSVERLSVVSHDLGIGMHGRKCFTMAIIPSVKSNARRFDHAALFRLALT